MGLLDTPSSRSQTFAVGSIIEPETLNDIQDLEIALANGTRPLKRPARARKIPALAGRNSGGTFSTANGSFDGSSGDSLMVPLEVQEGERLTSVRGRVQTSAGAGAIVMDVIRVNGSTTTATTLGTATSGAGGAQTLLVSGLTQVIAADEDALFARFTFGASSQTVRVVRYDTDVP